MTWWTKDPPRKVIMNIPKMEIPHFWGQIRSEDGPKSVIPGGSWVLAAENLGGKPPAVERKVSIVTSDTRLTWVLCCGVLAYRRTGGQDV